MEKVAIITGANSGVGFALAKRILTEDGGDTHQLRICLACRNSSKAENAKRELLKEHPTANIDLLQLDTSSPQSSINAAKEIKKRYPYGIRWLYCNAGIMPLSGINKSFIFSLKTRKDWIDVFSTGSSINQYKDWSLDDDDDLRAVFSTNVLGHYLMIKEMEDFLIDQTQPCHIIWTSSNTASTVEVDPKDIQCKKRDFSYPHSKRLMDLVSLDLNRRLNIHGVYSDTVCPGMVVSQITLAIMPYFFWVLLLPAIFLIRLFITHFITFHAVNGTEALIWLTHQDPSSVDHSLKYFSRKPPFSKTYVLKEKISFNEIVLNDSITALNELSRKYFKNITSF